MDAFKCCILALLISPHSFDAGNDVSSTDNPATCDRFYKDEHDGWVAGCAGKEYSKVPRIVVPDETIKATNKIILDLNKNNFAVLGAHSFLGDIIDQRVAICQLELGKCNIESIENDAFKGLEHQLETLWLDNNKLVEVPTDAITPLKSLQQLSLQMNPIERIGENAFSNMTSLSYLELNECKISTIDKNAFDSLNELKEIPLEGNMIKTLPWEDFERLASLKNIYIGSNPIGFDNCSTYYDFKGDDSEINSNSITVRVNEIIYIGEFNCHYDYGLHYVMHSRMYLMPNSADSNFPPLSLKSPSFYSRSDVKNFTIQLSEFSCGYRRYKCEGKKMVFQDEKDKLLADFGTSIVCNRYQFIDNFSWNIDCSKGNYTSIPSIVLPKHTTYYSKNISIDLSGNNINVLRENSFANVTNENVSMGKLNLARCDIKTIQEGAFNSLQATLIKLDLSGNKLVEIPNSAIAILVQLRKLILNGNLFAVIRKDSFPPMKSVSHLEMSNSNITRIDEGAFNPLTNLQSLILDGNCLKMLSTNVFDRLDRLSEIRIRGLILVEFEGFSRLNNCNCVKNNDDGKKYYGEVSLECETTIESNIRNAPADPNYSINQRLFTNEFVHDHEHFYCEKTPVDSKSSDAGELKIKKRKLPKDVCVYQKCHQIEYYRDNRSLDIDCANGDYSSIPSIFFPKVTLSPSKFVNVSVNLAGNNFDRIPANAFVEGIHNRESFSIVSLDLSSCKIVTIEKNAFKSLPSLLHLRLDKNQIRTISFDAFDGLEKLVKIDLRRNRLDIDLCWWKIEKSEEGDDSLKIDYDFNVGTEIAFRGCKCLTKEDVRGIQSHISCQTSMKGLTFPPSSFGSSKAPQKI